MRATDARGAHEVRLTPASPRDLTFLVQSNLELIADEGSRKGLTAGQVRSRMRKWVMAGGKVLLIEKADERAGYCVIQGRGSTQTIRQFFVLRDYRRQGIGLVAAKALIQRLQGAQIELDVLVWNETAVRFWRKVGFTDHHMRMYLPPPEPTPTTNGRSQRM